MRSDLVMSGHVLGGVTNIFLHQAKYFHPVTIPARLAQSVEHETLNLRVVGSSPTLGAFFPQSDEHLFENILVKMPRPGIEPGTFRSSV